MIGKPALELAAIVALMVLLAAPAMAVWCGAPLCCQTDRPAESVHGCPAQMLARGCCDGEAMKAAPATPTPSPVAQATAAGAVDLSSPLSLLPPTPCVAREAAPSSSSPPPLYLLHASFLN
jgi:hypothetical protein